MIFFQFFQEIFRGLPNKLSPFDHAYLLYPGKSELNGTFYIGSDKANLALHLRNQLRLKPELVESAQEKLHKIKAKFKLGKGKKKHKKKTLFVAVHSRRTDHIQHQARNGMIPLKPSYYLDAMDIFRQKFKKGELNISNFTELVSLYNAYH